MALALILPSAAVAAQESTYGQKPNTPTTGTSPSKETKTPTTGSKEAAPSNGAPAPSSEAQKASTLPFTGFDLRWSLAFGLVLMGAGVSIVVMQRRQRRNDGS